MIQTQDADKVIAEFEKILCSIKNNVFQRATNEIKVRVIISNLDEKERKNFSNIPYIYNKELGTQTKDEVQLLNNFIATIQQNKDNIQQIINDHIKAIEADKKKIISFLQETIDTNENLKNLKRKEKIMKIVESLEEEDRKKFKDIPNIFTKQTEKITKDEVDSLASFIVQINQQKVKTKILNKVKNITKNDADTQSLDKIKTLISGNEFLKTLFRTSNQKDIDDLTVNDIYNCKNNFLLFTITLNEQQVKNTNIMPCISQINSLKNLNDYYNFLQTILRIHINDKDEPESDNKLSTKLENYFSINNPLSKQNNLTPEDNKKIAHIQSLIDDHMKAVNDAKENLKASLNKINNEQFTNMDDYDKISCILNSLDEEERKKFKDIQSIFRQEWQKTTVEEAALLKEFTEAIAQKNIQSLIDDHMKTVNDAKETLKGSLNKINNEQFTNLNDCDKIICILNSLDEEEKRNFKEIPSIFNKEWQKTTVEEVELIKRFTQAHIDNKQPQCSLYDCDCNCLKKLFG